MHFCIVEDIIGTIHATLRTTRKACKATPHSSTAVQAMASFIEDCQDEAVAVDVLEALSRLLPASEAAAAPVAAALHRAGGLGLVAPLLRRPRQALRVIALRILAALLPRITDPAGE